LDDFAVRVEQKSKDFAQALLALSKDVVASDEKGMTQKQVAKTASDALQNIMLGFPMSSWCTEMQDEIAATMQSIDNETFSNTFVNALVGIDKTGESAEPPDTSVIKQAISQAIGGTHFKDSSAQDAIKTFLKFATLPSRSKLDLAWKEFFTLAEDVSSFLVIAGDETPVELHTLKMF